MGIVTKYECAVCGGKKHYFCPEEVMMIVHELKIRRKDWKAYSEFVKKARR